MKEMRPITVLPAVTKIFESTILHNLEKITESNEFSGTQRGFTKGKSTLDNISEVIKLATTFKLNKSQKDTPMLVFFDFNQAYDSISRSLLLMKLINHKTPWNIIRIIKSMLSNFKFKLGKVLIETEKGLI